MNQYIDRHNMTLHVANNGTVGATVGATIPIYCASEPCEIVGAKFVNFGTSIAASVSANRFDFSLLNGGTAGTALDSISSTVSSSVAAGWTIRQPIAITMNSPKLAAGQWLVAKLDHVGSGLVIQPYVTFDVVRGGYVT